MQGVGVFEQLLGLLDQAREVPLGDAPDGGIIDRVVDEDIRQALRYAALLANEETHPLTVTTA